MSGLFSPGKKQARRNAKRQQAEIRRQKQKETASLAETDDEIARRKLRAQTGGRQSLIATSPKGVTKNLGGS